MTKIKESTKKWYYKQIMLCLLQYGKLSVKEILFIMQYIMNPKNFRYPIYKARITSLLQTLKKQGKVKYVKDSNVGYWEIKRNI